MNKNIIIAVAISLLVGGGIGYQIARFAPATSDHTMSSSSDMQNTMGSMTADLKNKKGENLDIAFLEGMIVHHEGAIEMANIILKETKRPELKKMAEDIISAQSSEITMMKGWLKEWYGR